MDVNGDGSVANSQNDRDFSISFPFANPVENFFRRALSVLIRSIVSPVCPSIVTPGTAGFALCGIPSDSLEAIVIGFPYVRIRQLLKNAR